MATTKKKVSRKKRAAAPSTKSSVGTKKAATKKKAAPSSKKNPLQNRRVSRRAKQFPEGKVNTQLMVPTMRFMCLRCGEFKHVVWTDVRRKYVMENGGLPCERCGDDDPENQSDD